MIASPFEMMTGLFSGALVSILLFMFCLFFLGSLRPDDGGPMRPGEARIHGSVVTLVWALAWMFLGLALLGVALGALIAFGVIT